MLRKVLKRSIRIEVYVSRWIAKKVEK